MAFVVWAVSVVVFLFRLPIGHSISQWHIHIFPRLNQQRFTIITDQSSLHAQFRMPQFRYVDEMNFLSKPTRSFGVIATHCATFMVTLHLTPTSSSSHRRWWRRSRARYWVKLWLLLSLRSLLRMVVVVVVFTKGHLAFIPPGYHDRRPWWWWWLEYRKDDFLIRWNEILEEREEKGH